MSKIHILTGGNDGVYTAVVHITTPGGNNAANTPWPTAIINSGRAKTIMTTGTGAGQIASAEAAQVAAGTVIEGVMQWQDTPSMSNAERLADLDAQATQLTNELLARWQVELKYYGIVRA